MIGELNQEGAVDPGTQASPKDIGSFEKPALTIILGDNNKENGGGDPIDKGDIGMRHSGGANILWGDFHVEAKNSLIVGNNDAWFDFVK